MVDIRVIPSLVLSFHVNSSFRHRFHCPKDLNGLEKASKIKLNGLNGSNRIIQRPREGKVSANEM